ncbi:lmo0937 family membrane protein [Pedobacter sp. SD-b]|uniref:Lmo0937 family membrane protein n=1 Tax=Pedobacter segetis TaxID=2793069 RepID=A0ABS1BKH7_9SPHI|nr:lmo0937 family membrane protein [Pedobacter segetis]MBK0383395.1 lmo0937 family membrane protein [Pedobacter segetis]
MRVILNILAISFILGWILGFFVFSAGFLIHIFLILAIFALIINFLSEPV